MNHKLKIIARILMGLCFFVFGLNGFLNFIPQPPIPEKLAAFTNGMMTSVYFFPLLKGTETVMGLLLLLNMFVPLALTILAPIIINILCVHIFLAPEGLPLAIVIVVLEIFLAYQYKEAFKPMLRKRN